MVHERQRSRTSNHEGHNNATRRMSRSSFRPAPRPRFVTIDGLRMPTSPVLDTLFYFMAERHRIFNLRVSGEPAPWTNDEILATYPFVNVFRVYDRTTQYILRHVIGDADFDLHDSCFRVILFRFFNKIETWKLLQTRVGKICWSEFDVETYADALVTDRAIYGHAYIIPAPQLGGKNNAVNHLRLVQLMMETNLPERLRRVRYLKDAHGFLTLFPAMGDFTSLQLLLDLNMLPYFNFDENSWVSKGPGSQACLLKIFGPTVRGHELSAIRYLHATQHEHFARLGISPARRPRLSDTHALGVSMVDLEHSLCECEKYSRERHPSIKGKRYKVAKQPFKPRGTPTADLPQHWLRRRKPPGALPRPLPVDGDSVYYVSHIVAEKGSGTSPRYLVRWVGYGPDDDTWQHESDLVDGASTVLHEWKSTKETIQLKVSELQRMGASFRARNVVLIEQDESRYEW